MVDVCIYETFSYHIYSCCFFYVLVILFFKSLFNPNDRFSTEADLMQLGHLTPKTSPVTLISSCVVPAADAGSSPLITHVGVSVTLAGSAAGEAPVTRLASVTTLTEGSGTALALTSELVTKSSHRAFQAATTGWTVGGKGEGYTRIRENEVERRRYRREKEKRQMRNTYV